MDKKGIAVKSFTLAVLLSFAISGCATSSKIYGPDGSEAYSIRCDGTALSWNNCFAKAGDICASRGYEVLSKAGESGEAIGGSSMGFYGGNTMNRSMIVKCR